MTYDSDNVFAKILRNELPCYKIYETEYVLAFLDIMPRGMGHTLVIPKAGARNIFDVLPHDLTRLFEAVQIIAIAAKNAFKADGITIQQFNEAAGGQVVFHLHVHVIPRFDGVPLKSNTGKVEKQDVLTDHARKLRLALPSACDTPLSARSAAD